ncbi:HAD family hydrolase [Natronosporangium hydrolyticum]|uniref:HAD family hydrolase n=1 Tax=Natronosporangium hydrolyticum TaxID=2811111 RepID=A0A895YBY0_9ACTN|nr:HAD family hydrolase [Natronosporangium hydrolyticum]QSB14951.1 HAD family hydrolase [Natronosporangium hydrolyticum]
MITTVVFDADDTLVDIAPAVHSAQQVVLAELERMGRLGSLTLDQLRADEVVAFAEREGEPIEQVRRAALGRSLARIGAEAELDRLLALFFAHRFAVTRLYDEVPGLLAELRGGYALGFGTNGNNRVDRLGLAGTFAFTVYAHEAGVPAKPAAGFFEAVVKAAQASPESIVHIGDSYRNDVAGAAAAGLRTVWLNRVGAAHPPGSPPPDAVIRRLGELPQALTQLVR